MKRTYFMAIEDSYTYQQNMLIKQKIDDILVQLPKCCTDYIYSKISAEKFQPRTRLAYLQEHLLFFKYLCDSHEAFMEYKPSEIPAELLNTLTTQDIEAYLAYCELYKGENGMRQNNAPGKARKLAAIRSLFKYLVGRNILASNVAANVDTPTIPKHDVIFMNSDQQGIFLDNLQEGKHINTLKAPAEYDEKNIIHIRDVAIVSLFLGTGIRISELVGSNLNDLDFSDFSLIVTRKGGKIQKVYFSDDVTDALNYYLTHSRPLLLKGEEHPALFISQRRQRIAVRSVQALLKKYTNYTFAANDNWKITPHKLRSTFANNLLDESDDIFLTAEALGHSDLSTVQAYAKGQKRQRAAISLRYRKNDE